MTLTFKQLSKANLQRCTQSFHALDVWSPCDWATAMAGECGEACNVIKKLRRLQTDLTWNKLGERDATLLLQQAADEIADLVIYADLLSQRLGVSLGDAVQKKFNELSERIGSDVKL